MVEYIQHYGTPRHSGRYPWGSGEDPYQGNPGFLSQIDELKKQGMSESQICKSLGISSTQYRARKTIANNERRAADMAFIERLKTKGYSNTAIAERMGRNESYVRSMLAPGVKDRLDILTSTANVLKDNIAKKTYLDVGEGTENHMGISKEKLASAVAMLLEEGYTRHYITVPQLGTGKNTTRIVIAPPGTPYSEVYGNRDKIQIIVDKSEDFGRTYLRMVPPESIDSKRVAIAYAEDGGAKKDGVIELRRGVDDISLGNARYAQVRIAVDGTHYLKGMAVYSDNLPPGVDVRFNTNKHNTGNKTDAMKPFKADDDNPFGATIKLEEELITAQRYYKDKNGEKKLSLINVVNDEGSWNEWSKTLSSQMLSKQPAILAKKQLGLVLDKKKEDLKEILDLTNPTVKKQLLEDFAESCDSAAVHLKAAQMPRQKTQVILPIDSIKETEVYAPNFKDGEKVVLIRFPHGGTFEIPELTVNNKHPEAKKIMGGAIDAIGINHKTAQRLSGADFDGDTVLVIPNNRGDIKNSKALEGLKKFDPIASYPKYEGMKVMTEAIKQPEMGKISNLITDMTIKGATNDELARAVRHSMVVIDAVKHELNYKQSFLDNGIPGLKAKYQRGSNSGADTLISKSTSEARPLERILRKARDGGPVDPDTGKLVYVPTNATYQKTRISPKTGKEIVKTIYKTSKSTKMAETDNAFSLSSGTPIEAVYATHANHLKSLANQARKEAYFTKGITYSPTANKTYAKEVELLKAKLDIAYRNKPLERQAQALGNHIFNMKKQANPDMDRDDEKKIKFQALAEARARTGAKKTDIYITDSEWKAIQSGAISNNMLKQILMKSDTERVKELATPRTKLSMSPSKVARAKAMIANGYTQSEIADQLGVSVGTIIEAIQ